MSFVNETLGIADDVMKILVVDDNRDLADSLVDILDAEGYAARVAYTGVQAREVFVQYQPDAVVLDVKLPDVNGLSLFFEMHQTHPQVQFFLITGYRFDQVVNHSLGKCEMRVLTDPDDAEFVHRFIEAEPRFDLLLVFSDGAGLAKDVSALLLESGRNVSYTSSEAQARATLDWSGGDYHLIEMRKPLVCNIALVREAVGQGLVAPVVVFIDRALDDECRGDPLRSLKLTGCLFKPFEPSVLLAALRDAQE